MKSSILLTAALLTVAVSSQSTSTFTSPRGLDTTEGSSSHGYILGSKKALRWQQMDPTAVGNGVSNIRSIAWRRDAVTATNAAYSARTFTNMSVVMAHTLASAASTNYASNYVGSPTVVFTPKNVNAPDWSTKPAAGPSMFNHKVIFDTPWTYNGTDDLLWEVRLDDIAPVPTGFTNYPFDFNSSGASSAVRRVYQYASTATNKTLFGINYGTGCTTNGSTTSRFLLASSMRNDFTANTLALRHGASRAPANSSVVTLLGVVKLDQPFPGLCSNLYTNPATQLPMGTASSTGSIATQIVPVPNNPNFYGAKLYMQAAALDTMQAGLPVAVSQGEEQIVPDNKPSTINSGPWTGGIVAQFEY